MDAAKTVTAQFTDNVAPSVTPSLATGTYTDVQSVTLTSSEAATIWYTLDGSDPTTSATRTPYNGPIAITANATLAYYAIDTAGNAGTIQTQTYTIDRYTLKIIKYGKGLGTVTSDLSGINCGSACSATYAAGATVTLTAVAGTNASFIGWKGGDCSGTGTSCTVTMDKTKAVGTIFMPVMDVAGGGYPYYRPKDQWHRLVMGRKRLWPARRRHDHP